ncbi:hypothetical protein [Rhizobium leguminosarum]|uniref:hypothetical protein n=1 Tax=Rhizobium leguminosarum TaxID=384 RepID=UPI001C948B2E|nr:hypothetical protein [Rhizobium leguminosarum]MBY5626362.1 hypothetical protein [Rhizobium leguminosarum]
MSPEQKALLDALRDDLSAFKVEVRRKNKDKQLVVEAINDYDGGGKIFEAFLVFRLKANLEAAGFTTEICNAAGQPTESFILRGAPGHLRRKAMKAGVAEPGFISIIAQDHDVFELHNSVEWPDHLTRDGEYHEFDVSVASTTTCTELVTWYRKKEGAPSPILGLEAKFHGEPPGKNLAREVTGLAIKMRTPLVYLVSSKPAGPSVTRQLEALRGVIAFKTKIVDAGAIDVRVEDGVIDASKLSRISDEVIKQIQATIGVPEIEPA